jgi:nucleosome binding factor SPN SPT16 subunit
MSPSLHSRNPALNTSFGQDVQFYREASDVQFDETGNRKRKYRYGDEDEIEMEQQERKRRQMLNKEFRAFSEKIAEAAVGSVRVSRYSPSLGSHSQFVRLVTR